MPKLKGDPGLPHLPACCQTGRRTLDSQQTPVLRNSHDRCAATCSNSVGSPSLHFFAETAAVQSAAACFRPTAPPFADCLRRRTGVGAGREDVNFIVLFPLEFSYYPLHFI